MIRCGQSTADVMKKKFEVENAAFDKADGGVLEVGAHPDSWNFNKYPFF